MASVRERVSSAGRRSFVVSYRHGKKQSTKTFGDKKSADRLAALINALGVEQGLASAAEAGITHATTGVKTLDELFEQMVTWKAGRRDITDRGAADYRRAWANHMSPVFGHRGADYLTERDVQQWIDDLTKRLAPKTVRDLHALLHQVYSWAGARTRGLASTDPCTETELPKRAKSIVRGLSLPEYQRLVTAARALNPDAADFIIFLGCTGWRFSEAAALPAWAVEDNGHRVHVTLSQVSRRTTTGYAIVADAKSQAGLRRVRLIGESVAVVRRRIVGLGPDDLVFTTPNGGRWFHGPFRDRQWLPAVAAAGLADRKPTPHWLRHSHVAMCHAAGMTMAEMQRRIGHEDIRTTINVYGRMIEDMPDDVADRLDLLMGATPPVLLGELD
jgi:site-specific recombinase XerD